jgi:hypothetical protein
MQQSGEQEPFIDEILRNLQRITADLSPLQIHTFYEAVGYMISEAHGGTERSSESLQLRRRESINS